jgi:hypothetical protein
LFAREAAAYLHDTPAPGTLSLTDYDEATVLLEAEVADSRQLRWWLRGFGDEVVYGHSVAQHIDYDLNSALQKTVTCCTLNLPEAWRLAMAIPVSRGSIADFVMVPHYDVFRAVVPHGIDQGGDGFRA